MIAPIGPTVKPLDVGAPREGDAMGRGNAVDAFW
jgi:hypothetical protein